jgi:hypothetical protein
MSDMICPSHTTSFQKEGWASMGQVDTQHQVGEVPTPVAFHRRKAKTQAKISCLRLCQRLVFDFPSLMTLFCSPRIYIPLLFGNSWPVSVATFLFIVFFFLSQYRFKFEMVWPPGDQIYRQNTTGIWANSSNAYKHTHTNSPHFSLSLSLFLSLTHTPPSIVKNLGGRL